MHLSTALFSLVALTATTVSAVGNATVVNKCSTPIYLWSVGSSVSPSNTLAANTGSYTEVLHSDPKTGGIALKITTVPNGLVQNKAQLNFAYAYNGGDGSVYYDLSSVFGNPFDGKNLSIKAANGDCPSITWAGGKRPDDARTEACFVGNAEIVLTVC